MKKLITLILIFVCSHVMAADYYFSMATGDDTRTAAQAQNPATPWKTLTKAQTVATTGNRLYFQRGDTWVGTLVMQGSGTSGTRVVIGAYGTGAKPIITGFANISAWTNTGGNIWESTSAVSTLSTCNIASINNANYSQGRTPNSGYYTINSTNGTSTITSTSLNAGTINWTGAQVVMRKYRWIMDKYTVTSASGSTINFTSSGDAVQDNYGFFLINDVRTLDQANEWCYNSSTKKMSIYATSTPTNVKVPTIETGIDLNGKNYITIDNINITGFNSYGVKGTANNNIDITNCSITFIGNAAVYLYVSGSSSQNCNFTGNTVNECNSMGFHMGYANSSYVTGNTITQIGRYPGMGQNGDVSYCGIVNWGDNHVTSYNSLTSAGYCGIRFDGNSVMIQGNFVDSTNFVKDDGGGIYVYPQQTGPSEGVSYTTRTVRDNIVLNTIGAKAGGEGSSDHEEAMGIYNDGTSPDIDYINNTVAGSYFGFFSNSGKRNLLDSNTFYNCRRNIHVVMYNGYSLPDWTITNNISVAKETNQYALYLEPGASTIPATWTMNYNVYARPIDDNETIWYDPGGSNVFVTLAQWKASSFANGQDAASTKSPIAVSGTDKILFLYNRTNGSATTSLGENCIDMRNNSYPGTITLAPMQGVVLLKTGASNTPPTCTAIPSATITLPINSVSLNGVATSTTGGSIVSWAWVKTSGGAATITNASAQNTTVTGLAQGSYVFTLTATDNNGLTCTATKSVTVNAATPLIPPTVNAGVDQSIQLPTNSVTVTATAVASSGSITGYSWLKVSGGAATITSATSASTTITGLVAGTYLFSVTATQTNGLTATDTMQVVVSPANALPATGIKYFQASFWKTQKQVVGGWTSTITENTLYFQFQKKTRNGTWGKVGANIIPKIGEVDYWGYDFSPTYGKTSSYRVKVFDKTGVTYSSIVNVYVPPKTSSSLGGNIILE